MAATIPQNSTLSDIIKISYVGRLWCLELIPDIEKFLAVAIFKKAATIPHKFNIGRLWCPELISDIEKFLPVGLFKNGHHNTSQIQHCPISTLFHMWVDYDVPKWFLTSKKFLPVALFKKGHHNTAQIQHCPISTTFHMLVDYDVPKWFLTLKNFYRSPFSKWPPQYRKNSTLSNIIKIWYVGR